MCVPHVRLYGRLCGWVCECEGGKHLQTGRMRQRMQTVALPFAAGEGEVPPQDGPPHRLFPRRLPHLGAHPLQPRQGLAVQVRQCLLHDVCKGGGWYHGEGWKTVGFRSGHWTQFVNSPTTTLDGNFGKPSGANRSPLDLASHNQVVSQDPCETQINERAGWMM
jgi:hypothetical protein